MSPDEIALVKSTWRRLGGVQPVAALFYRKLFSLDSSLRTLFLNDPERQEEKFHATLDAIIEHIDQPQKVISRVHNLGISHAGYGVREEHYSIVEQALLWALEECLQDEFTEPAKLAWQRAYRDIADGMIAADLSHGQHPV